MSTAAIRTVALCKEYRSGFWMRRVRSLHGIDLKVENGESFGFVGPNGAGKTTTIKILAGLLEATSGEAEILGQPASDPSARFRLGFLPERPYFYVHLSAREVLRFYGKLFELPEAVLSQRIEALLERTDMTYAASEPLGTYSKGMLQRIGLCQTLLHEPELIILDEPMSGLDPIGRALVRDIITQEKEKGKTIFFSSHVLSDVESICDRIAIIVGGKIRGVGSIDDIVGTEEPFVDCHVRGIESLSQGTIVRRFGEIVVFRVGHEVISEVLAEVQQKQGQIREVVPVRRTLEEVLVDEVARSTDSSRPVEQNL